ncbi:3-hydroxyacyl-CoA dehydrogenase [Cadophora sp. DSE1049]|nr:3-hydroxyacyl-CoA dehydrogenase [Cadophora sp. DSE1049]
MASLQKSVALIGAGTQGTRLAFMWSRLGRPVHLVDQDQQRLQGALTDIQKLRRDWPATEASIEWGNVTIYQSPQLAQSVANSWLIVECVPESLDLKKTLVGELDTIAQPDTIIASNSSSYTISEIVDGLLLKHPERCVSLHSYWPPETSAIEVMGSSNTSPDIIPLLMEECRRHGFQPFHVKRPSTGYIYNRIWAAIKRESLLVLSEGVADPEEIDSIFKDILKSPKGPCEQMDIVGLDVVRDIENHYREVRKGLPKETTELLNKMIAQGKLGVKSGSGFYDYKTDT